MNKLVHFMTGWLSILSISNLMGGLGMELWRENLLGLIGGIFSAIIIAWLCWRWEHPKRDQSWASLNPIVELPRLLWPGNSYILQRNYKYQLMFAMNF